MKTDEELLELYEEEKVQNGLKGGAGFTHWGWFQFGFRQAESPLLAEIEKLKEKLRQHEGISEALTKEVLENADLKAELQRLKDGYNQANEKYKNNYKGMDYFSGKRLSEFASDIDKLFNEQEVK